VCWVVCSSLEKEIWERSVFHLHKQTLNFLVQLSELRWSIDPSSVYCCALNQEFYMCVSAKLQFWCVNQCALCRKSYILQWKVKLTTVLSHVLVAFAHQTVLWYLWIYSMHTRQGCMGIIGELGEYHFIIVVATSSHNGFYEYSCTI